MGNVPKTIDRRSFIVGGIAAGAAALSAGALAGCGGTPRSAEGAASSEAGQADWKTPPEPIDLASVAETIEADIVVVGAGTAGIPAALTAVEDGAQTVLLEKGETHFAAPNWFGGVNSRYQQALGIELDRAEIVGDLMRYAGHRADQRLINLWFDHSGEAIDWYGDELEESGTLEFAVETDVKDTGGKYLSPVISHVPVEKPYKEMQQNKMGTRLSAPVLLDKAVSLGVDVRYLTPAVQLVCEDGRVSGVIAQNQDGAHLLFKARKGVVLATGGYSSNRFLMEQLNPNQTLNRMPDAKDEGGDGFKLGVWAGGDWGRNAWVMTSDRDVEGGGWTPGSQPWLRVNAFGERFCNEDAPYDFGGNAGAMTPGNHWWNIFDANYWDAMTAYHTTICSRMVPQPGAVCTTLVPTDAAMFDEMYIKPQLEKGNMVQADTLEELAEKMAEKSPAITPEALTATVERYNELCAKGVDEDFGKMGSRMVGVAKPPFYAMHMIVGANGLAALDGLRVNTNLEVIDPDGTAIKGLYAVGNDQGGFYGMSYPWYYGGLHAGKNLTFARLAVKHALAS